jgi:hypothetical protein
MIPIPGSSICYKKICRCSKLLLGQKAEIKHRFEEAGISPFFEVICNSPFHLVKPKTSPEHLIHPNPSFCCYLFIDKPTWYLLRHFWGAGQFIEFGLLHISVLTYYIYMLFLNLFDGYSCDNPSTFDDSFPKIQCPHNHVKSQWLQF